jgi:transposase-like protein
MKVIPDFKAMTIIPFLHQNISPGSTVYTDGLKSFESLTQAGFKHIARTQPTGRESTEYEQIRGSKDLNRNLLGLAEPTR